MVTDHQCDLRRTCMLRWQLQHPDRQPGPMVREALLVQLNALAAFGVRALPAQVEAAGL